MSDRSEDVADFYERVWRAGEGDENRARWALHAPLVELALARLGDVHGMTVLEIGPGVGAEAARFVSGGARTIVVDVARSALARASAAAKGVLPIQAAAEILPLADASVDRVFAQTVLMHLNVERAASEWWRVLRPGGRAVILEPLAGNPAVGLYRRFASPYRSTEPRYVTVAGLRRAADASGLRLAHHEVHLLLAPAAAALPGGLIAPVGRALARLDRHLLKIPGTETLAWMVVAEFER